MSKEDERDSKHIKKIIEATQSPLEPEDYLKDEPIYKHRGTCRFHAPRGQHSLWPLFPPVNETLWCGKWKYVENVVTAGVEESCENCYYFRVGKVE